MQFKAGVNVEGVAPEIWFAVGFAVSARLNIDGEPVTVTSMRDGQHMEGSLHYAGRAVDIRTRDMHPSCPGVMFAECRDALSPLGFDVVLETNPPHLHIEYDPKGARMFPAVPSAATASAPGDVGNG